MKITPYTSLENLFFTDTREEIRVKLSEKYEFGIKEFEDIKQYYDYFYDTKLYVYYNQIDEVIAFESFGGLVFYDGINLLETPFSRLLKLFSKIDDDVKVDYYGFTSFKTGIGIDAPEYIDNPDSLPHTVIVFRQGYYDKE